MSDDIVKELSERAKVRYMANCKCGRCQLVTVEQIDRAITALESHRGRVEVLEKALIEISRLRLATNEGTLRVRADRMWDIAEAHTGKAALSPETKEPADGSSTS